MEQIEQSLWQLSPAERRQLAQWFLEHADEFAGLDVPAIHPEVKAKRLRRRDEADARPELLEPWAGTTGRVRARLHEFRRQIIPAR